MKDPTELELLLEKLRWLRLPGMARNAETILDGAARDNWTPLQIMNRLCDEERQSRINSAVKRRITDARFPEVNTVDGFDFDFDFLPQEVSDPLPRASRPHLPR